MSPDLTGKPAEAQAEKKVADAFVSLRGALAYTALTQAWIMVYIVSLQRVQQPTNLDVRRLNAVTRKLQKAPQTLVFPAMKPTGDVDIHSDSGYRKLSGADDEVKGYGMRGMNLLRRGRDRQGNARVHLLDAQSKSHRLRVNSSYGAEGLAAAHAVDEAYPSLITLHELQEGVLTPKQLRSVRENGGLKINADLTVDAESVYKSLSSADVKTPTEKSLLGHVMWVRELLAIGVLRSVQWCDTRDMTADGHTKGCIDRDLLLKLMGGWQQYKHDIKRHIPHRAESSTTHPR